MSNFFDNLIDESPKLKMNNNRTETIVAGVLLIIFGGVIVYTEFVFPFTLIKMAFEESQMNMFKVNWLLLISDYRTSLIGCAFSILGGILLIRESRYGWVLSTTISLGYLIIYSLEFIVNIGSNTYQTHLFLIIMICILLLTSLILVLKQTRTNLKIGCIEVTTFIIISIVFLQQYYR